MGNAEQGTAGRGQRDGRDDRVDRDDRDDRVDRVDRVDRDDREGRELDVRGGVGAAGVLPIDGRRARRERNKSLVLDTIVAMLDEGLLPTSAEVAERAGLSERSLFRHFGSREALLAAAVDAQIENVAHLYRPIDATGTTEQRVRRFVAHRAGLYETTAQMRRIGQHYAAKSESVRGRIEIVRALLRAQVEATFATELDRCGRNDRRDLLAALDVASSWDAWELLRTSNELPPARARAAMRRTLAALLASCAPDPERKHP